MKIKILFFIIIAACFVPFLTATNNPKCGAETATDDSIENTQFTFVLDRSANTKFYKRYVYLLKQFACMIPKSPKVEISLFSYSLHPSETSFAQFSDRERFEEVIFSSGYSRESLNYNFCDRFKRGLARKETEIKNYFKTVQNMHIIVPIVASAEDANLCSMSDVFEDFMLNVTRKDLVTFHGIYFDATADPVIKQMGQIVLDIPNINVINPDEKSMIKPPSTYTRTVRPILEVWESFINEAIKSPRSSPSINRENDESSRNVTFSADELYQVDGPHEHLLIILVLVMVILGLLMIIASLCLWYFMRRDSQNKIRESKTRTSTTGTPSKERRSTPPRVSLSGMDSIDEFYIEPSAEMATQTPQTKTPTADKTPKNPSREDISERKNFDVEQGGGDGGRKVRRGSRGQKPPPDFRIE